MKLLTIAVPCYNSEAYMDRCLETLLPGGEDVEILIIDDGSKKDRTPEIADAYGEKYPGIVRVIHQENKGHGGAVNTGIDNATGLFFKVCDSDDWFDADAYRQVLETLRKIVHGSVMIDVLFSNYTYNKENRKTRNWTMHYEKFFPQDRPFGWNEVRHIDFTHYVLMHSIIYRTQLLRDVGLRLPEHTFYVDNIYAYKPFSMVHTMYYLNVNLYQYYIGRPDQSVNIDVMMGRLDQQLKVNYMMIDYLPEIRNIHGKQKDYILHYLTIITSITSVLMIRSGDPELLRKKKELWLHLKEVDPHSYYWVRRGILGQGINLPGKGGRRVVVFCYRMAQKLFGFE